MKTISGPVGLPQSCAEIVSPSGVFTQTCLNFLSCAMVGTALAVRMKAAMDVPARRRTKDRCVMANGPPFALSAVFPFRPALPLQRSRAVRSPQRPSIMGLTSWAGSQEPLMFNHAVLRRPASCFDRRIRSRLASSPLFTGTLLRTNSTALCWSIPCHNQANPLPTNDTPASDIPQCFQCPAMLSDGGVGNRKVRYRSARIPSPPSRGGRSLTGKVQRRVSNSQAVRSLSASGMKGSQSIWLLSRLRVAFSDSGKGRTDSAGIYFRRGAYWFEWTEAPTCLYQGQFPRGAPSFAPTAERFIQ